MHKNFHSKIAFSLYVASLAAIYVLVLVPGLLTPFHSDDYGYFLQGMSIKNRVGHYVNWSGRVLADLISSSFLNLFSHTFYSMLNAVALVILVGLMALLPGVVYRKPLLTYKGVLMLWLLFLTYWVANSRLSQTTFWMVGAANYLWPMTFTVAFYFVFFKLRAHAQISGPAMVGVAVLAFLSGMSNEAMGASLCCFLVLMLVDRSNPRKITVYSLGAAVFGFAILYFAPGNLKRLSDPVFAAWRESSAFEKFYLHFFERMPEALGSFWFVLGTTLLLLLLTNAFNRKGTEENSRLGLAALFFALGIFSMIVFVKAPTMPERSLNTALMYFLLTLSFVATGGKAVRNTDCIAIACGAALFYFIPSYYLFTCAMKSLSVQAEIRTQIIEDASKQGVKQAVIPDWYFTRLLKDSDKMDVFQSPSMEAYYGMDKIVTAPVGFDYSLLKTQAPMEVNLPVKDGLVLEKVYREKDILGKTKLIFQFNLAPYSVQLPGEDTFFLHLFEGKKTSFINADMPTNRGSRVGKKFYMNTRPLDIDVDEVYRVDLGFASSTKGSQSGLTVYFPKATAVHKPQ